MKFLKEHNRSHEEPYISTSNIKNDSIDIQDYVDSKGRIIEPMTLKYNQDEEYKQSTQYLGNSVAGPIISSL